jgi:DNA-binding IclR family transcriptional regulator
MASDAESVADRLARLLVTLGADTGEGLSLGDVAERTGLPKGSAHRLLRAWCKSSLVYQDVRTRNYALSASAALLANRGVAALRRSAVHPSLMRLAAESSDTAYGSVAEGASAVCIGRELGAYQIRTLTLDVGDHRPLGVGAGSLALLAAMPDDDIETVCRLNSSWLALYPNFTVAAIWERVAQARELGYGLNKGGVIPEMCAIGVVVHGHGLWPDFALSIAAIRSRMSDSRISDLAGLLRREASEVEARLSGLDPQLHALATS